jgi:hypothetical protein
VTSPRLEGHLDGIHDGGVVGWAWDASQRNRSVDVCVVIDGGQRLGAGAATFPADLEHARKGNGRHGPVDLVRA